MLILIYLRWLEQLLKNGMVAYQQRLELNDNEHFVVQGANIENTEEHIQVPLTRWIYLEAPEGENMNTIESGLQGGATDSNAEKPNKKH